MRLLLEEVKKLAERAGLAVTSIGHFNKDGAKVGIHRLSGAGALAEVPRAAWAFVREPEEEEKEEGDFGAGDAIARSETRDRLMLNGKLNVTSEAKKTGLKYNFETTTLTIQDKRVEVEKIKWGGATKGVTLDGVLHVGAKTFGPKPEKTDAAKRWLKEHLADGEMHLATDVYSAGESIGHVISTIKTVARALRVKFARPKNPGSWYMQLPRGEMEL